MPYLHSSGESTNYSKLDNNLNELANSQLVGFEKEKIEFEEEIKRLNDKDSRFLQFQEAGVVESEQENLASQTDKYLESVEYRKFKQETEERFKSALNTLDLEELYLYFFQQKIVSTIIDFLKKKEIILDNRDINKLTYLFHGVFSEKSNRDSTRVLALSRTSQRQLEDEIFSEKKTQQEVLRQSKERISERATAKGVVGQIKSFFNKIFSNIKKTRPGRAIASLYNGVMQFISQKILESIATLNKKNNPRVSFVSSAIRASMKASLVVADEGIVVRNNPEEKSETSATQEQTEVNEESLALEKAKFELKEKKNKYYIDHNKNAMIKTMEYFYQFALTLGNYRKEKLKRSLSQDLFSWIEKARSEALDLSLAEIGKLEKTMTNRKLLVKLESSLQKNIIRSSIAMHDLPGKFKAKLFKLYKELRGGQESIAHLVQPRAEIELEKLNSIRRVGAVQENFKTLIEYVLKPNFESALKREILKRGAYNPVLEYLGIDGLTYPLIIFVKALKSSENLQAFNLMEHDGLNNKLKSEILKFLIDKKTLEDGDYKALKKILNSEPLRNNLKQLEEEKLPRSIRFDIDSELTEFTEFKKDPSANLSKSSNLEALGVASEKSEPEESNKQNLSQTLEQNSKISISHTSYFSKKVDGKILSEVQQEIVNQNQPSRVMPATSSQEERSLWNLRTFRG